MKTRMTELLGIQYPIMQGGMQHLGVPELAAAVSEAGGLGTINVTIYPDPEDLRKAIKEVKAKTDKPFAVNISLIPSLHPGQELFDQVKVILEEGVTAVETAGASPQELADVLNAHKDQVKWIHKAACVKHAKKAESMGADIITMAGFEVAGHPHTDGVGTMVLANRTAREVKVPVLAAGGIADGRGIAAAFMLGAVGVQMGTRFLLAEECGVHQNYKDMVKKATDVSTTATGRRFGGSTCRVMKNQFARHFLQVEYAPETTAEMVDKLGVGALRKAAVEGDTKEGCFMAGQIAGMVKKEQPAAEIVREIAAEAEALLKGAAKWVK